VLFKATLPEAVVETTMMFILQVQFPPRQPPPLTHCASGYCRPLCSCCMCS
jgi:hypothetical protein